jgi:hypothetical protein
VLTRVLLPYTNLSLSSFELLYEDTAVDFLGNAKAYVLLLTTAALAARFNLRYGWDFGGILVPALLGLLWFTPTELAITLAEALLLGVVGRRCCAGRRWGAGTSRGRARWRWCSRSVALKWLLSLGVGDAWSRGCGRATCSGSAICCRACWRCGCCSARSARKVLLPTL